MARPMTERRFRRHNPCPICGGHREMPQGKGERCWGFLSEDGLYAHCTRPEYAGDIEPGPDGAYAHRLTGPCRCGKEHAPNDNGSGAAFYVELGKKQPGSTPPRHTEVRTKYPLLDEGGNPILHNGRPVVHTRIENGTSKRFEWPKGVKVTELPLYGSHFLRHCEDGDAVLVVEGEKATEALWQRNIFAVGTVTGADNIPSDDALRPLVRLSPVLWPDNDEKGRRHMARIAERLRMLGAKPSIVEWPDAPPKGDAADFPGTNDEMAELVRRAVPYEPESDLSILPSIGGLHLVSLADVEPEEVRWLAYPYLPMGKLIILEGDPGTGKSHLTLALATAVSLGHGFPGMQRQEPGKTIIFSGEDGLRDTIRPRLEAMEPDFRFILDATDEALVFDDEGKAKVELSISVVKPKLVIIDPLVLYMGSGVDLHRANETRAITGWLAALAERYGCAIVAVRHLKKSSGERAIYRGLGSIDIVASARSVLLVGYDPDDRTRRAFAHIKSNLAPLGEAQGFTLEGGRFAWTGTSLLSVDAMLAGEGTAEQRSAIEEARAFIREMLRDGPVPAQEMFSEAKATGISETTLKRAKSSLGIVPYKLGIRGQRGGGGWFWELPANETQAIKGVNPPKVIPLTPLIENESEGTVGVDPLNHAEKEVDPLNQCPDCSRQLDANNICWKCDYRLCAKCGVRTGSAFRSLCTTCAVQDDS